MKKAIKYIALLAVAGIIVYLIGNRAGWWQPKTGQPSSQNTDPNKLQVDGVVIKPGLLQDKVNATGSLIAEESVELSTETAGRITSINFEEGQQVEKGQLLLKIDDAELTAQLKKTQHQLKLARTQEDRLSKLQKLEAISQDEYDLAITNLLSLQADSTLLATQISKSQVRAPFSGKIGLRKVSPGAFVTANTVIASLVKTQPLKLQFSIPERYVKEIKSGQEIYFKTVADTLVRKGKVYAFEPEVDASTRSIVVRARYENKQNDMVPGYFADVQIVLHEKPNALMVPSQAIIPELGKVGVYRANNGTAELVEVKTGLRTADAVEIIEGLNTGDTILVTGMLQLKPDMPIKVTTRDGGLQ